MEAAAAREYAGYGLEEGHYPMSLPKTISARSDGEVRLVRLSISGSASFRRRIGSAKTRRLMRPSRRASARPIPARFGSERTGSCAPRNRDLR